MTTIRATLRTFVAIELPDNVLAMLGSTQDTLRQKLGIPSRALKWTRPEGIHLTLQFLGEVPVRAVGLIEEALKRAADGKQPFALTVGGLGVFPNPRRPRVLWIGVGGNLDALRALTESVWRELRPLGFTPDHQLSPHLTLARVREDASPQERAAVAGLLQDPHAASVATSAAESFDVSAVSLMRSDLQAGGAVYSRLADLPLR